MKYSFLMPYTNRQEQFWNTLISLERWYGERDDWEIRLVIDGDERVAIPFQMLSRVFIMNQQREGVNPAPLFNLAADYAEGEYLIITNPECYHAADLLSWFDDVFSDDADAYAVAACDHVAHQGQLSEYTPDLGPRLAYYQHSIHKNNRFHFCSAMSKQNYQHIGGFDEAFSDGYCFDDDDFRDRVLHAGIECTTDDSKLVLHQAHAKLQMTPDLRAKWQRNKSIYENNQRERSK